MSQYQDSNKAGQPPGTLVYVGTPKTTDVNISEINFNPELFEENEITDIANANGWKNPETTSWIQVSGIHNTDLIQSIGNHFNIDKLVLEDIVNTNHRPKFEEHDDYLFLTLKSLKINTTDKTVESYQKSLILGDNWIISFNDNENDEFNYFKDKIRQGKGPIRKRKANFLFYRGIDTIVDHYYIVSDFIDEQLDALEQRILQDNNTTLDQDIYELKKKISNLKYEIVPLREAISGILRSDSDLVDEDIKKYMQDVYEHVIHVIESIDRHRETISDFLNLYMSGISNKMNEVMKMLTIFASIFIPLTFIAGIYGMNFENMPELSTKYGYAFAWGVMILVAVVLLVYFRRKKWL